MGNWSYNPTYRSYNPIYNWKGVHLVSAQNKKKPPNHGNSDNASMNHESPLGRLPDFPSGWTSSPVLLWQATGRICLEQEFQWDFCCSSSQSLGHPGEYLLRWTVFQVCFLGSKYRTSGGGTGCLGTVETSWNVIETSVCFFFEWCKSILFFFPVIPFPVFSFFLMLSP